MSLLQGVMRDSTINSSSTKMLINNSKPYIIRTINNIKAIPMDGEECIHTNIRLLLTNFGSSIQIIT